MFGPSPLWEVRALGEGPGPRPLWEVLALGEGPGPRPLGVVGALGEGPGPHLLRVVIAVEFHVFLPSAQERVNALNDKYIVDCLERKLIHGL